MKFTQKLALAFTGLGFAISAQAFDVDLRGEYRTGSDQYRSRVKLGNTWKNGIGATLEAGAFNGNGSLDSFRSDFNEIEAWYGYKLNDTVTLVPGGAFAWNINGSTIKPYMRVNWAFIPTWRADVRLRYDHDNYDTSYNNPRNPGQIYVGNNDAWQFDFWLTKWIGAKTMIEYNYVWNKKDNSEFVYNNGRDNQYLHNIKTVYSVTPLFNPYFEVGYLGNVATSSGDQSEWRLRLGTVLKF